jgi:exonuclease VII small subunit
MRIWFAPVGKKTLDRVFQIGYSENRARKLYGRYGMCYFWDVPVVKAEAPTGLSLWTGGDAGRVVLLNKRFGAYRSVETSECVNLLINDAYWLDNAACVTRSHSPEKAEALLERCYEELTTEEKEFLTRLMSSVEPVLAKDETKTESIEDMLKDLAAKKTVMGDAEWRKDQAVEAYDRAFMAYHEVKKKIKAAVEQL